MEGVDALFVAVVIMSALLIWRHSKNISNLLAGKESKIGSKSGSSEDGGVCEEVRRGDGEPRAQEQNGDRPGHERPAGPVPGVAGSAAASTAGGLSLADCPRFGTATGAGIVAVKVAAQPFADAAVQRRGQSASDSPPTSDVAGRCMQGLKKGDRHFRRQSPALRAVRQLQQQGDCHLLTVPDLGPRQVPGLSLSKLRRSLLLTPRSSDGDSQRVTVPPLPMSLAGACMD